MRFSLLYFIMFSSICFGQSARIEGRVFDALNNNSLEFAKVQVLNMQKGAITDEKGFFRIDGLEPGVYSFKAVVSG